MDAQRRNIVIPVRRLGASVTRRIRAVGAYAIRRAGLLPGGVANGLGEDKALADAVLPHDVMVFFPDSPENLYQLEQWYAPLRALDRHRRVVVVLQDSRTAKAVRRDAGLDAVVVARQQTMDALVRRSALQAAIYVNHHPENFVNLRFGSLVHVSLLHGDSDKAVSASNQAKAYDFAFVAGRAAIDRVAAHTRFYDAEARCLAVGRPQVDEHPDRTVGPRPRPASQPPTVLYAPTWEGSELSSDYGSVDSHGPAMVRSLLEAGLRVIYRPHPLTGVRDADYAAADARIRDMVRRHEPAGRLDLDVPLWTSFSDADALICDVSGVAVDWLAVDRPLMITTPARSDVAVASTSLLRIVPRIGASEAGDIAAAVRTQIETDPFADRRRELTEYYLGDVAPGSSTRRFVEAVDRVISLGKQEDSRLSELRRG